MENDKALIVFTAIGPTFRKRVIDNIRNHDGLNYFDTLVVTDIVEDFDEVKRDNLFIKHIDNLRDDWSKENEVLPVATRIPAEYANDVRKRVQRYPYSVQRYCFNFENIEKYKGILVLDCDIEVKYNKETVNGFFSYLDSLKQNTVTGHNVFDYSNNEIIKKATDVYSKKLNIPVVDYQTGYILNDGPVRIYKFIDKQSIQSFLDVYSAIVKDAYESKDPHLVSGSWNILAEPVLAIIYKLLDIKVVCRSFSSFTGDEVLMCRTFPEDRFWDGFPGWEFNTTTNSSEEYVKVNYTLLKKFYEQHNHSIKWPY